MKKCIVINGISGAGKDTFIDVFASICNEQVYNISSITPINEILKRSTSWNGTIKDKPYRDLASGFKKLLIDYDNTPFNYCLYSYQKMKNGIMFMHIREPEEINKIKKAIPDVITILIDVNEDIKINNDTGVYDYQYDYIIHNKKIEKEDLIESASILLSEIFNETF